MGKGVFGTALSRVFKWFAGVSVRLEAQELLPLIGGFEAPKGGIDFEDGGFYKTSKLIDKAALLISVHRKKEPDVVFTSFLKKIDELARTVQMNAASSIGHLEGIEINASDFQEILKGRPYIDEAINSLLTRTMGGNSKTSHALLALGAFRQGLFKIANDHPDALTYDKSEAEQAATKRLAIILPDTAAPSKSVEDHKAKIAELRANLDKLRRRDLVQLLENSPGL